jgi:hypothetical protein
MAALIEAIAGDAATRRYRCHPGGCEARPSRLPDRSHPDTVTISPGAEPLRWRGSGASLPIHVADMLDLDVTSADSITAGIGVMLDGTAATVLIIDDADALPVDAKALAFALRRLAAQRGVAVVLASGRKAYESEV